MARVLVVDDEPRYRELIQSALTQDNHEVQTAADGQEAMESAFGFQPEVLITDWMLKAPMNGLDVVTVLRSVFPELRAILITGFATEDLILEANQMEVCEFLPKPFSADPLRDVVRKSIGMTGKFAVHLPIGILEIGNDGTIHYANRQARLLLGGTAVWASSSMEILGAALSQWRTLPGESDHALLHVRARRNAAGNRYLAVLLADADVMNYKCHPVVRLLLGVSELTHVPWPYPDHVLVVDNHELVRRVIATELRNAGCFCHAAGDGESAVRLFEKDPLIRFVLLDYHMPGTDIPLLVARLRQMRPEITLVGCSGIANSEDFATIGVDRCIQKPFSVSDFINLLTGSIGRCVECSLPIPLRHPRPGESPTVWVCCFCGARYRALLDENASPEVLRNVRPAH